MKTIGRIAVLAAVGLVSVAGVAGADTVTGTLNNVSPARIVGINYNGSSLGQAYAGVMNWQGVGTNGHDLNGSFTSFCIDLTQDVYLNQSYTYTVAGIADAPNPLPPTAPVGATGMGLSSAQRIEKLYALEYDNIGTDNDRGAAFQLAIWEMLFDTGPTLDVTTGLFNTTGASANVITLANQFVSAAIAPGAMTFHHALLALTSPTTQDQIVLGLENVFEEPPFQPPNTLVPTPAAAFGAIPLLAGMAFFRRAKRRDGL
jgi:hypothetical protein